MTTKELLQQLNEGFKHTLPSGLTVTMRRISLEAYRRAGTIPTHLQNIVAEMGKQGLAPLTQGDDRENDLRTLFEWVICESLIDPKVAPVPTDPDTLPFDYLLEADKQDIFTTAFLSVTKAVLELRPLSKPKAARGSASSTPSPSATDADLRP